MKNSKNDNKRTAILAVLLLGLMVVAYKVVFAPPSDDISLVDENIVASQRVEAILSEVMSINFDTSVMEDPKFKSLKSIETPLISLPVGKKNPFSGNYGSN